MGITVIKDHVTDNNVNYGEGISDFLINFIPSLFCKKTAINETEDSCWRFHYIMVISFW